jgi:uncharacterized protein
VTGRALITIRVHPGASRAGVAAEAAGAGEPGLYEAGLAEAGGARPGQSQVIGVWVHERAAGGKATEAALAAVAAAVGVRRASVRLVTGARSRIKVIEITDPPADVIQRLAGGG